MFYKVEHENQHDETIIIYGAGRDGICTFITLLNAGIYVSAFCDADPIKQKMRIMNKKVMSPEELGSCENKEQIAVYIGSKDFREEIKNNLEKMGFKEIYENRGQFQTSILIGDIYRYRSRSWYTIIEQSYKKYIFVFGNNKLESEFATKLKMTDICIEAFVVEDTNQKNDSINQLIPFSKLAGYPREKIMIYILDHISERVKLLEENGYIEGYHYRIAPYIASNQRMKNPYVQLDVNTGYSYVDFDKTPGYTVLDRENNTYTILVLGASATDQNVHYYPSWVNFYKDYLEEAGVAAKIYNGGSAGYSTQQNLIKLIRDLPIIKPDLVVDYGGGINALNLVTNEEYFRIKQPFANRYTEKLMSSITPIRRGYISENILRELYGVEESKEVCIGFLEDDTRDNAVILSESYLYTVKCMNAICKMQGVKFLNFLDPLMVYSEHLGIMDMQKLYNDWMHFTIKQTREEACRFRKEVSEKMDVSFQSDLTQILSGDEMWEDIWHPNEKGNQIIGRYVYEKTMDVIKGE